MLTLACLAPRLSMTTSSVNYLGSCCRPHDLPGRVPINLRALQFHQEWKASVPGFGVASQNVANKRHCIRLFLLPDGPILPLGQPCPLLSLHAHFIQALDRISRCPLSGSHA